MNSKRKLALGAALTVALALGGAAVAAAAGHGTGKKEKAKTAKTLRPSTNASAMFGHFGGFGLGANLATAASYLGVTAAALKSDLQSGKTLGQIADATSGKSSAGLIQALVTKEQADLAAAVTSGKLTQAQSDAISANLTARVTAVVNGTAPTGPHPAGPGFGRGPAPGGPDLGHHGFGPGGSLSTAATYLGVSTATLLTDLKGGKTLAQIADGTSGKSSAGLIQALVADQQADLAAAVTAGKLTQAQSDALSANLTLRVTALVNGTPPARAYGGHGGWQHGAPPTPGGSNA